MPTLSTLVKQGAFDNDLESAINTNFANINTVLGAATTAAPTGTGSVVLSTNPTVSGATLSGVTNIANANITVGPNFIATENGANNAIACAAASGPALTTGLEVAIQLAHTLQAGANTFAYNGGTALGIKSHYNTANNIGTAYAATGIVTLIYNGTLWLDMAQ